MTWTKEPKTENVHLFVSAHRTKKEVWPSLQPHWKKRKLFSFSEKMISPAESQLCLLWYRMSITAGILIPEILIITILEIQVENTTKLSTGLFFPGSWSICYTKTAPWKIPAKLQIICSCVKNVAQTTKRKHQLYYQFKIKGKREQVFTGTMWFRKLFPRIFRFLSLLSVAAFKIFNLTHTERKKIQNIFPVSETYKPVPITTMNWVHIWSSRDRWQLKSKCSWENGIGLESNRQSEISRLSIKILRGRSSPV